MKKLTGFSKKLLKNEGGQGMVEYILLLVVIVAIVMLFKGQIKTAVEGKVSELKDAISGFSGE